MSYFDQLSHRLLYRKLNEGDIKTWVNFFNDNDHLDYLGIDRSKSNKVLSEEWISTQWERYDKEGLGHLAVELIDTGELIGMTGILSRDILGEREYEIAYSLLPKYWGKGYATEMASCMKAYALKNINAERLISIIDKRHKNSIHVAQKNGMKILFDTVFRGMSVSIYGLYK